MTPERGVRGVASRLQKARMLSAADCRILIRAGAMLFRVELLLRRLSFEEVLVRLERGALVSSRRRSSYSDPARVVRLVGIAAHYHPLRPACLGRALVTYTLLRRGGHDAAVVVGVAPRAKRFRAHAWIELGGSSFSFEEASDYERVYRFAGGRGTRRVALERSAS